MFWLLAALLSLATALMLSRPFWRRRAVRNDPAAAYDLEVYRDQLAEVERDLARGVLDADEAKRLRTEIGRKVLDADRALSRAQGGAAGPGRGAIAAGLAVIAVAGAGALYATIGRPDLPDRPRADRIAAADRSYRDRPSQAEAEAAFQPAPRPQELDPQYLHLIEELRAAVQDHPDKPEGLALLAEHEARLGNHAEALSAQKRLLALKGEDATAEDHAVLAALMAEAAGGLITPEGEAEMREALRLDPSLGRARYLAGLLAAQNGRPDKAFEVWARLLEDSPPDAPWNRMLRPIIADLAWVAGQPDYTPPHALRGPDAADLQAAEDMTPEARDEMVRNMVEGLEARLASSGGTPAEWAQLITSLVRMGDPAHAAEIYAEARARFAADPAALSLLEKAAESVGLE